MADALRVVDGAEPQWPAIAHHLLAAGNAGRDRAIEALAQVGEQAASRLAFTEAIAAYESALAVLPEAALERRAALLLGLAHAQLASGALGAGRASCQAAAALARQLGDAALLARVALAYGSVFVYAQVDPELVRVLEEALRALGDRDSDLRARVLARLAAALQPAPDPRKPMALAREAIALARRLGDESTLLATLSAGCSAFVELIDPSELLAFNQELVALAEKLGDRAEAFRAYTRLVFNHFELGDLVAAELALISVKRIAAEVAHPYYEGRALALQAMRAMWDGQLAMAEVLIDRARAAGERGGDPNIAQTFVLQRTQLLRLLGRTDELREMLPEMSTVFRGTPVAETTIRALQCALLVQLGDADVALAQCTPEVIETAFTVGGASGIIALAELAVAYQNRELAARVHARMIPRAEQMVTHGIRGMTWDGPMRRLLALAALTLGREEEACQHFEAALRRARALGGRPVTAMIACEYAEFLASRVDANSRERSRALAAEAETEAQAFGMSAVRSRAMRCRSQLEAMRPATAVLATVPVFRLYREGESWCVDCGGVAFRVRNTKGMRLLAQLVTNPGQEFHVLDLLEAGGKGEAIDTGDAGEVLDSRARSEYRRRIKQLQEMLAEAEAWNDTDRIEHASTEIELLTSELSRALGLSGRERRAGSAAERARVNVQRRLRDAIQRIGAHHPVLGRHLDRSIRTGTFCSYLPE